MDTEQLKNSWETWGVAIVVGLAVIVGLNYKSLTGDTLADAVKDVGTAMVPVFAAIYATRKIAQDRPTSERFMVEGEAALCELTRRHRDILAGPKKDRGTKASEGEPEDGGKRYLFVQQRQRKDRAQIIPLEPLSDGVVEIRVSKKTLKILGIPLDPPERVKELQQAVASAVRQAIASSKFKDSYEENESLSVKERERISIQIDFEEESLGYRKFRKAVVVCGEAAIKVLLDAQKETATKA